MSLSSVVWLNWAVLGVSHEIPVSCKLRPQLPEGLYGLVIQDASLVAGSSSGANNQSAYLWFPSALWSLSSERQGSRSSWAHKTQGRSYKTPHDLTLFPPAQIQHRRSLYEAMNTGKSDPLRALFAEELV